MKRNKSKLRRWDPLLWGLCGVIVLLGTYRLLPRLNPGAATAFPSFVLILREFTAHADYYGRNVGITAVAAFLGLILGGTVGAVGGVLAGISRRAYGILAPVAIWLKATPIIALSPFLTLVLIGNSLGISIASAAAVCFFPVFVNVRDGLRTKNFPEVEYLLSLGATRFQLVVLSKIPRAAGFAIAGFETASTLAIVGATAGEFLGARSGLGYIVLDAQQHSNYSRLMLALLLSGGLGVLFFALTSLVARTGLISASMAVPTKEA